jgi:two-component system phosphate regulon response regulator PhoB
MLAGNAQEAIEQAVLHRPELVAVSSQMSSCVPLVERLWREVCREDPPFLVVAPQPAPPRHVNHWPGGNFSPHAEYAASFARAVLNLLAANRNAKVELRDEIVWEGLRLDRSGYHAVLDGQVLDLTLTEFNILWALARQPDRVRTRQELVEASRGIHADIKARTIDVHIKSLRRKLGPRATLIATIRGVGYRLRRSARPARSAPSPEPLSAPPGAGLH